MAMAFPISFTWSGVASDFARVHFASNAYFVGAEFTELAVFEQVQFDRGAVFDGTVFSGDLSLYGSRFPDVAFRGTQFRDDTHLGPFLAMEQVDLSGATFAKATTIEVVTKELVCYRTRFEGSTNLRVRNALIVLDSSWFGGPSTVSFAEAPFERRVLDPDERPLFETELVAGIGRTERPVLVSLRQVDAGPLVLSGLDLSSCYFNGAFDLDRLKIEGPRYFALTPRGVRVGLGWPPVWRWTTRSVLADECAWRAAASLNPAAPRPMTAKGGWDMPPVPAELSDNLVELFLDLRREGSLLGPDRIASLYRSLRKGYEDSKNEPGAADFYYGETEMRRLNAGTPRAERLLLFLYWLTSGVWTPGSRALLSLFFTIAMFAVALHQWGFTTPRPFVHALLFSAQSTTSLLRAPEESLTYMGQALQIALRLLGPLFFALTVLALAWPSKTLTGHLGRSIAVSLRLWDVGTARRVVDHSGVFTLSK